MKYISFGKIKKLKIRCTEFIKWTKECITLQRKCVLPKKISMKYYINGFINVMPSIIPYLNVYGVKIITRNSNSVPQLKGDIVLFDLKANNLICALDGKYITTYRTAAMAVLAIKYLANSNFKVVSLLGLGNVGRTFIDCYISAYKDKKITLKLLSHKKQEYQFIDHLSKYKNINIEICNNYKDLIVGSDVVVSAISFTDKDISKPEWFKKGALLVPIHTRGFQNCDAKFDKIVVDDISHVCDFKYFNKFKSCVELCDVINNKAIGRKDNKERIIAYNIGISILDIYFAYKIIKKANIKFKKNKIRMW